MVPSKGKLPSHHRSGDVFPTTGLARQSYERTFSRCTCADWKVAITACSVVITAALFDSYCMQCCHHRSLVWQLLRAALGMIMVGKMLCQSWTQTGSLSIQKTQLHFWGQSKTSTWPQLWFQIWKAVMKSGITVTVLLPQLLSVELAISKSSPATPITSVTNAKVY